MIDPRANQYDAEEDSRTAYGQLTPEGQAEAREEALIGAPLEDLITALEDRGMSEVYAKLIRANLRRVGGAVMSYAKEQAEALLLLVELQNKLAEDKDWDAYKVMRTHIEDRVFSMAMAMARELTREEGSD